MEILLNSQLIKRISQYDLENAKKTEVKPNKFESIYLKRKSNFPICDLDLFQDISTEKIIEVHETLQMLKEPYRSLCFEWKGRMRLILWDSHVWKAFHEGDKDCPFILFTSQTESKNNKSEHLPNLVSYSIDKYSHGLHFRSEKHYRTYLKLEKHKYAKLKAFIENVYQRNNIHSFATYEKARFLYQREFPNQLDRDNQVEPNLNSFIDNAQNDVFLNDCHKPKEISESKFVRKEILKTLATIDRSNYSDVNYGKIEKAISKLKIKIQVISLFYAIFNNIDYIPSICEEIDKHGFNKFYISRYELTNSLYNIDSDFSVFFKEHIQPTTFVNWMLKQCEINVERTFDSTLMDTMSMLYKVYNNQDKIKFEKPKRWRLTEVHDYLSGLIYKLEVPLEVMPQDLIPVARQVDTEIGMLRFFQPKDNHELAHWGKMVRNCVGNGSYSRQVIDRKNFLILVEKDNVPWCTAQFRIEGGVLKSSQIVQIQNRKLTPLEEQCVSQGLTEVLNNVEE